MTNQQPRLRAAYAEAKRLFPHWPEKDLWAEARYILKHGLMPKEAEINDDKD